MNKALEQVMDALDVETFFVCGSEEAGRGVGVRGGSYVYRPADRYRWLLSETGGEAAR